MKNYLIVIILAGIFVFSTNILAAPPQSPIFENCGDQIFLEESHCETFEYQFKAYNPNSKTVKNVRYHLVSGPGEINSRTGLWSWKPEREDVAFITKKVVVSASIGNNKKTFTVPNKNCKIEVRALDPRSSIKINSNRIGNVLHFIAPGITSYDIEFTDLDSCDDISILEFKSIEPELSGSITIENGQLVANLLPEDAEKKFTLTLQTPYGNKYEKHEFIFDTRTNPVPEFGRTIYEFTTTECMPIQHERAYAYDPDGYFSAGAIHIKIISAPDNFTLYGWGGDWSFHPDESDVGKEIDIELAAVYGDFMTSGDQNCIIKIRVLPQEAGIILSHDFYHDGNFNCGDTVKALYPNSYKPIEMKSFGSGDCEPHDIEIVEVNPQPAGIYFIRDDDDHKILYFKPAVEDGGMVFNFSLRSKASYYEIYYCDFNILTDWEILNSSGLSTKNGDYLPIEVNLHQNHPNPFNNSTLISFDLPQNELVNFKVYNILGQTIYELERSLEAGTHYIDWNGVDNSGTSIASGIYYYRIRTDNFTDTKKMLLIK